MPRSFSVEAKHLRMPRRLSKPTKVMPTYAGNCLMSVWLMRLGPA